MEKEFYYLDEKEQKGPFTVDELSKIGLKLDTLVWTEGFENWRPVKEVEELKAILKKLPPPPPIIDNSTNSSISPLLENQEDTKNFVEDSDVKFWASFKIYGTAFFIIGLAVYLAFQISENKKQKLKKEIYSKVDNILEGKTVVLDGIASLTEGELEETNYNSKKNKTKKRWRVLRQSNDSFLVDDNSYYLKSWWEREKLYTIYKASRGGFTIKQITKQNEDGYDVETITSGDMGYKKPSNSYVEPEYMDMGWGERTRIGGGYYSSNYRLSVRECYTQAYEFFTKDDRKSPGAYTPGKFIDITNFSNIKNEYYFMDHTTPKQINSNGIFAPSWQSQGEHSENINTEDWAVYYSNFGNHYEITENLSASNKDLFKYLAVSVGSILLILIIISSAKPEYFRNLNMYGKRWKNTAYENQIFFFEHSFFGKNTFIEIINDKVSKGVIKFTDKGNTINLSYTNKELFYKIEKIDQDNLILVSIKDKSNISFRRVGAKEIEEIKTEEKSIQIEDTNPNN